MKRYHICYAISDELCTGITLEASSYEDAIAKANVHNQILYVCIYHLNHFIPILNVRGTYDGL